MLKNKPFCFSVVLVAAYLLGAYLAVPYWLLPRLEQYAEVQLGRQLQLEKLQFDPLTWSAELTGVRLAAAGKVLAGQELNGLQGDPDEQELFPDIALTAESVHLRFNFWRLRAAVSSLVVKAPLLTIDGAGRLMQSGHYPFVSLWRAWHSARSKYAEHQPVSIRRWRLESGRMVLTYPGAQTADEVLLDDLLMQAGTADDAGRRGYTLAFTSPKGSAIRTQGEIDGRALVSEGQYQWTGSLPQNGYSNFPETGTQTATRAPLDVEFTADGQFSISAQDEGLSIELFKSQLSSDQLERCVLNSLVCAKVHPLNLSFSASLLAAMRGVHLLGAQVQLAAFQLDAKLAQGAVTLARQLTFDSASMQVTALFETPDNPNRNLLAGDTLEFDLALQLAGNQLLNAQGQFHPQSEHAELRFTSRGEQELEGDLQWQQVEAQQAKAAYPQLELRLENPKASLARGFIAAHLSDRITAESLQLSLTARLSEGKLAYNESIRLEGVAASTGVDASTASNSVPVKPPTLNTPWLLAMLQNPESNVELTIAEYETLLPDQLSVQSLIQAPILAYLEGISAQPFEGLASQMGKEGQNLAKVQFESGSAELSASSSESLTVLADALMQRPGLGIQLAGVYDPLIDNKALQAEQTNTHIGLATAADLAFQSGSKPPDFSDPTVHSVIDEFARRRLPAEVLKAFAGHFGEADVDRGVIPEGDIAAYYSALYELLVDHAEIPQGALVTLARYRAQAVTELLERRGVSSHRLHTAAEPHSSAAELTGIPLQLQLFIYSGIQSVENPELPEDSQFREQ